MYRGLTKQDTSDAPREAETTSALSRLSWASAPEGAAAAATGRSRHQREGGVFVIMGGTPERIGKKGGEAISYDRTVTSRARLLPARVAIRAAGRTPVVFESPKPGRSE